MSRVLGSAIKNDRERLGISQSLLARAARVSQQILSRWESGDAVPRGERLEILLSTLGPHSETRRLVGRMQEIDPSFFESPSNLAAFSTEPLRGRIASLPDSKISMLATRNEQLSHQSEQAPVPAFLMRSSPSTPSGEPDRLELTNELRMQFTKAADQLVRATNLLGKVAAIMAESGAILSSVGERLDRIEKQTTESQADK
jgi:transcriptional regulator with XRE-family HTH domain